MLENKLKLEKLTIHLAIEIYDAFVSNWSKNLLDKKNNKELIILTIIFISAKYNERDEVLISSRDLQKEMGTRFSHRNLIASEKKILKTLNWNIKLTTLMNYVQFYYSTGIIFTNDKIITKQNHRVMVKEIKDLYKLSEKIIRKCERFADLAIVQNVTKRTETRMLALAWILWWRKAWNIEPVFNENFRIFYNISQKQIEPYFLSTWKAYEIAKTPIVFMSWVDMDNEVKFENIKIDDSKKSPSRIKSAINAKESTSWSSKRLYKSNISNIKVKPEMLKFK